MKKPLFIYLLSFFTLTACQSSHPEKIVIQGHTDIPTNYKLYLQVGQEDQELQVDSLTNTFTAELSNTASGFLTLRGVVEDPEGPWPFSQDIYCTPGATIRADLKAGKRRMEITADPKDKNNSALIDYNRFSLQHLYELWTKTPPSGEAKAFLQKYSDQAKQIIRKYCLKDPIKKYLQIRSYLDYTKAIDNFEYIYRQENNTWPGDLSAGLASPETILDDSLALLFPEDLQQAVYPYLRKFSRQPEEQLNLLQEKFTLPQIREKMTSMILETYVQSYNYSQDFESGLNRLRNMCVSLPDKGEKYIRNFEAKRHTIAGSPLPEATLETPDGKQCKLSDLQGQNLYIDLWASWCVPCCKEVPYLQQLEKEMKNKNVKFISISLDENKKDWKERMKQLHMEGNQYIVVGKELVEMLNVKSIPHFLIYNKAGHLAHYQAPRPSQSEAVKKILNNLK